MADIAIVKIEELLRLYRIRKDSSLKDAVRQMCLELAGESEKQKVSELMRHSLGESQKVDLNWSRTENTSPELIGFIEAQKKSLKESLFINDDLLLHLTSAEFHLFGVDDIDKEANKVFICTLMPLANTDNIDIQMKLFRSNLRWPLGLIITSESLSSASQYLKALRLPFSLIISIKSTQPFFAKLHVFKQQRLEESSQLTEWNLCRQKSVITKCLAQTLPKTSIRGIEIDLKNNCIREQTNEFPYKLKSNFLSFKKHLFMLYSVEDSTLKPAAQTNNIDHFRSLVKEYRDKSIVLATTVYRLTDCVSNQFLELAKLLKGYVMIQLYTMDLKKTVVIKLKDEEISFLENKEYNYASFEEDTSISSYVVAINKQNEKNYL